MFPLPITSRSAAALCDYKGARAAIASGKLAAFHASLQPGTVGSIEHCRADARDVADSLRSFPSGHSAGESQRSVWPLGR